MAEVKYFRIARYVMFLNKVFWVHWCIRTWILKDSGKTIGYDSLVYTKPVNSAFRAAALIG